MWRERLLAFGPEASLDHSPSPWYHFHFLLKDRQKGGHILECKTLNVTLKGCVMNEMYVSLPETEEFLKADLTRDLQSDLASSEQNREERASIPER